MSDYGKLIEALRDGCDWTDVSDCIGYELLMHDAAAAIEALQAEVEQCTLFKTNLLNMREISKEEVDEILEYIRTTPVGPIEPMLIEQLPKRGEWIGVSPFVDSVQCSECGYCIHSEELETPYCPWCGAKMKMEVQDGSSR